MSDRATPKTAGKRTLAGVGALLAVGLSAPGLAACTVEQPAGARPPAIVLEDVEVRHYAGDGTLRVGHAERVTYHRQAERLEAEALAVASPPTPDLRRGGLRLEAGRGEADLAGKAATLAGGVAVETGAGDRARTASARWNAAAGVLDGSERVEAEGPGYRASADGFSFHEPDQRLDLRGDVRIHTDPAGVGK